jgi:predicted alpha/beta-fold hydrolase
MPLLDSTYRPPWGFANGHMQSIWPALGRRVAAVPWQRQRIDTPDDDFLDLDTWVTGRDRVAILSHGLEGNANQPYIRGMAHALRRRGWDVVAWNCRGCSGEPNRQLRFYHSGSSDDLGVVIEHMLNTRRWHHVALVGFSLGGNQILKYLGEKSTGVDSRIVGAVAFSVTCDLAASSVRLGEWRNRLYMARFMHTLRAKVREKAARFPGRLDLSGLDGVRTFREFDDRFTAPLHGFTDAADYWEQCGSIRFVDRICRPTLLVNAADDPFLAGRCFPREEAAAHAWFHLEVPSHGGHVGFVARGNEYWSEARAGEFLARIGPA